MRLGVKTLFIEPGIPWENRFVESFNGKMRIELLNLEKFDTLYEAKVLVERWRHVYNRIRPHSSLGFRLQHLRRKNHGLRASLRFRPSSMVPGLSQGVVQLLGASQEGC